MRETSPSLLVTARSALDAASARAAGLVRLLPPGALDMLIPGSEWTIRQAGAHLVTGAALAGDIATGMPSPVPGLDPDLLAADNAQRIADIPESNPGRLGELLGASVQRLLSVTAGRHGDETVVWHGGRRITLSHLVCLTLGEQLIHGADMAAAAGRSWLVDPAHTRLVAAGYAAVDEAEFQLDWLRGRTSWTWL